jgi:ribosomal-protein-alanine N-acetyltransferase
MLPDDKRTEFIDCRVAGVGDSEGLAGLKLDAGGMWSRSRFENELSALSSRGWVALGGDAVKGYLLFRAAGESWDVVRVAVERGSRRQGIGGIMLRTACVAIDRAGGREVFLEVRVGNEPGIALYRSVGFQSCGHRSKYYEDNGEDALVMRLDLSAGPVIGGQTPGKRHGIID